MAAFNSTLVLLIGMWISPYSGTLVDTSKDMEHIRKCMASIKMVESRCCPLVLNVMNKLVNVVSDIASLVNFGMSLFDNFFQQKLIIPS